MQVLQLVRVSHHVDRRDLAVLDVERGGLQFAVGFARDEAGQAGNEGDAHQRRRLVLEDARQQIEQLHDRVVSQHGRADARAPAAAVSLEAEVIGEHGGDPLDVAASGSDEEGLGQGQALLPFHLEARARLANMRARAHGELAAGRRLAPDRPGDLVEAQPEQPRRRARACVGYCLM